MNYMCIWYHALACECFCSKFVMSAYIYLIRVFESFAGKVTRTSSITRPWRTFIKWTFALTFPSRLGVQAPSCATSQCPGSCWHSYTYLHFCCFYFLRFSLASVKENFVCVIYVGCALGCGAFVFKVCIELPPIKGPTLMSFDNAFLFFSFVACEVWCAFYGGTHSCVLCGRDRRSDPWTW